MEALYLVCGARRPQLKRDLLGGNTNLMNGHEHCVRRGTWLYDNSVRSRVEVWRRTRRPGTGDHEDPAELANDQPGEWYEVLFAPAGGGTLGQAGGGYYPTLAEALERVRIVTNGTVRWGDV
jgi:hypothetical protein